MSRLQGLVRGNFEIAGYAKMLAGPNYSAGLRPEKFLRRVIPFLILTFLAIIAIARLTSLIQERAHLEADAQSDIKVAAALIRASSQSAADQSLADAQALLTSVAAPEMAHYGRFAVISDESGKITATLPGFEYLVDRSLQLMIEEPQALLSFGERAGVRRTVFSGQPAYVATAALAGGGFVTLVQPTESLLTGWRRTVSLNVTLFSMTSLVMLVILYAYFRQAGRAEEADALYMQTHRQVDMALARGRCGLWDWDIARGRMYWSRSMFQILGMESRDGVLTFAEIAPLMHPEDGGLFHVARQVADGSIATLDRVFRMRRSDGDYIWLRARADVTRTADDEIHLIGIAVDVSDQQELARRSSEAGALLNNAIENISETFVLCDEDNRVVLCNSKYRETFGLKPADVTRGTALDAVMEKARRPIETVRLTSPTFAAGESAVEAQLPDGRWLLISERRTGNGSLVSIGTDITQIKLHQAHSQDSERRLLATIEDLTAARREADRKAKQLSDLNLRFGAEKERAESASRAKTTFLANMSHELRTPLNAILGFSDIMRQNTLGPLGTPKYSEYAEDIHLSGRFLLRLIDDILDMAKIEAGRVELVPEDIELGDIVSEATKIIEVQARDKDITVQVRLPRPMAIRTDRRATKQVILNLLSNAVKFTGHGGAVKLKVRTVGANALISVADNGMGIPREALQTLGRPFEQIENELTRKNRGTGLGLAIARSLVELHGGRMRISSRVGAGTVVALRLPLDGLRPRSAEEA
ncbi:PAS domain-containing sensor histidine kinase [Aurantimonas sp. VKM B-3413]|uniref:PAS domain-containing sensor histidine kinase n=1 Tax=Aurantimonas sp. VKM B-3413 TaxID=2779401 RepID=UPI001E2C922D|nr:ATP-binding protein [Aurantimonas sp. VKM B-3413]MCB8836076.1 PAS-domain containing protein [Aurantimonas sp. VKM B-3413]